MTTELVDVEAMREMADGCGWTVAELAGRYRSEADKEMASIAEALDGGELAEAARHAHGLAGASETAGVRGMGPVMRRLEQAARAKQAEEAGSVLEEAAATLATVKQLLAELD